MSNNVQFSLILPCYNEGPTFDKSFEKIYAVVSKLKIPWEIIFVEDKSTDDTKKNVVKTIKNKKNIRAIFHSKNQGRGKTVSDGIIASKGNICGFIDFDCEVSPRYIPLFIDEVISGSDLVVARRFYEKGFRGLVRVVLSSGYSFVIKLFFNLPISDTEAGYKFFNRKSVLPVLSKTLDKGWFWDTEICIRSLENGFKITELPVLFVRRPDKKSTVNIVSDSLDYLIKLFNFKFRRND